MKVGLVAQRGNTRAAALADELRETLSDDGATVRVDETTGDAIDVAGVPIDRMEACDLVVSIGGDGTFLYAARGAGSAPVMGVNLGEVGFLNAVAPGDAVAEVGQEVARIRKGTEHVRTVPRLCIRGDGWRVPPAINEVVVQGPARGHGGGVNLEVRVDGSLYAGSHADGVMIATPTGSTAYNLSEGGPLVHPGVDGLVVTEMVAEDPMPSLVLGTDHEITIRADGVPHAFVVSDGRERKRVETPATVTVTTDAPPVRMAGPTVNFFEALGKLE